MPLALKSLARVCALLSVASCPRTDAQSTPPKAVPTAQSRVARVDLARVREQSAVGRAVARFHDEDRERRKAAAMTGRKLVDDCFRNVAAGTPGEFTNGKTHDEAFCRRLEPMQVISDGWQDPWGYYDGIDAELTIQLVAITIAQSQGYAVIVDETERSMLGDAPPRDGSDAPIDVTDAVIAALALEPIATMPWLVGEWQGVDDGTITTELWCPGDDGRLLGDNRTIEGGREVAFEWLTIVAEDSSAVYLAQPSGRTPPTRFETRARQRFGADFENPTNDFPQILQYGRIGFDLQVTATGKSQRLRWTWARTGANGPLQTRADVAAAVPELAKKCAAVRDRKPVNASTI